MRKRLFIFTILAVVFMMCFISCSSGMSEGGSGRGDGYSGSAPSFGESGSYEDKNPDEGNQEDVIIPAGQLTACAYDDNEHFAFWQGLLSSNQEGNGIFKFYYDNFAFKTLNRIQIKVPTNMDVLVHLVNEDKKVIFTSIPDANGIAYLYPQAESEEYNICLEYTKNGEIDVTMQYETIKGDTEFIVDATYEKNDVIQLMFVIDTTGSMGDEIRYLKSEIIDIISQVKQEFSNSTIELAIMLYRDKVDDYVTKYSDFSTDIKAQQEFLSKQSANGGGDFPEAVDVALEEAASKQWTSKAKTKILVHVADAPAHDKDVQSWENTSKKLASQGIRVITVASSGIDQKTEYFFRNQSIMTNGKYVYLTDDSGIGNSHLEATVEEKPVVEFLNACLVRLIKGYHTGIFEEPIYYGQKQ